MERSPAFRAVRIGWIAVPLVLSSGLWTGPEGLAATRKELAGVRAVVEYPYHGISVYTATGKLVRRWEEQVDHEGDAVRQIAYYSPDLHPGARSLVCIRCVVGYEAERRYPLFPQSAACDLTELSIDEKRERVLLGLPQGHEISAAAWSPDGATVAFVQDEDVVLYSVQDEKVVRTIPHVVAKTFGGTPPVSNAAAPGEGVWSLRLVVARLRWARDGSSIYVYGRKPFPIEGLQEQLSEIGVSEPFGVATVALGSGNVSWLNLYNPGASRHWEIREGKWTEVETTLPAVEPIKALFGSDRHSVREAQFTSDGKSFMYTDSGSGLFWRDRLMRYDIAEDDLKCVKTLERGLYRE